MYVARMSLQQTRSSAPSNQSTTERPEVPERPERPEQPERPEAVGVQGPLTRDELREQIRANIQAATQAARDARADAQRAGGRVDDVRIINGVPVGPDDVDPRTAGTSVGVPPGFPDNMIPNGVVEMALGFFTMCAVMVVGWPLARAFGRRIERNAQPVGVSPGMTDQLQRIEQAVDAMSVEIERISESQRFLAKLQSSNHAEHASLPASDRR